MIKISRLRDHCENIKRICDDFINKDPIYFDPGNNYEEIVYINGQIDHIIFLLDQFEEEEMELIDGTNIRVIYDPTILIMKNKILNHKENSPNPYENDLIPKEMRERHLQECLESNVFPQISYEWKTDDAQIPSGFINYLNEVISLDKMIDLFGEKTVTIYGEGYGPKIQSGSGYGATEKFIVFDILVGGKYWLKHSDVQEICENLGLDVVPSPSQNKKKSNVHVTLDMLKNAKEITPMRIIE